MSDHVTISLSDGPLRLVNDPLMGDYQAAYVPQLHTVIYGGEGETNQQRLRLGRGDYRREAPLDADRAAAVASIAGICDAWIVHRLSPDDLSELRRTLDIPEPPTITGNPPEIVVTGKDVPGGPWTVNSEAITDSLGIVLYRRSIPEADDWRTFQGGSFRHEVRQSPQNTATATPAPEERPARGMSLWERLRRSLS